MMHRQPPLILASASKTRKDLLHGAGLKFEIITSNIDEGKTTLPPKQLAPKLAGQKALSVSEKHPNALVIGGDQVLELNGKALHKAKDKRQARAKLLSLKGKTHLLRCGVCVARDGKILWQHLESASLAVRDFSNEFLDLYIEKAGEELTASVGAYALEGKGAWLFDSIDGDYFTILGLPLIPLLRYLRDYHEITP